MNTYQHNINREVGNQSPQPIYAGIDISKDFLDVCLLRRHYRFTNDPNGHHGLLTLFKRQHAPVHALYESTGYLSRRLVPFFRQHDIAQSCLNPLRVRNFARSEGIQAKTDRLDALVLSRMGQDRKLQADSIPDKCILLLREYESVLGFCIKRRTQLKNQLAAINESFLKKQLESLLKQEEKKIVRIQEKMEQLIECNKESSWKYQAYQEVSGIGKRSAMALLSRMPEPGRLNRKEAASLLGVAPYVRESGNMKGAGRIQGGRKELRSILYMGTVSAVRSNKVLREKYDRLIAGGKSGKCAVIACSRTLIIHLNGVARRVLEKIEEEKNSNIYDLII
ncbi:IS110 family transposase [Akkermansia sp.]|uniref:IS110 family transposase n=1 Tax=Akkermansia sp. TaxID=1872421 RepID=UPI0025C71486|nr:IS110 family transposase [Akkermansia sp.]MCC8147675.1 IS110 family transposase [Akkermansia sp.]